MESRNGWELGEVLGERYKLERRFDAGGMGLVYLAHDRHMGRDVVIKRPRPDALTPASLAAFDKEVSKQVRHEADGIVRAFERGEHCGVPYLVMPYMAGGSLADRLPRQRDPAEAETLVETLRWLERIARVLDRLHAEGVFHQDVKPANILFDRHDDAYLADFGIASSLSTMPTLPRRMQYTRAYAAPEVRLNGTMNGTSDQYSLAATVYHFLSGQLPRKSPDVPAIPLIQVCPRISERIDAVVMQGLADAPGERYPSCMDFARALRGCLPAGEATRTVRSQMAGYLLASIGLSAVVAWAVYEGDAGKMADPPEVHASAVQQDPIAQTRDESPSALASGETLNQTSNTPLPEPQEVEQAGKAAHDRGLSPATDLRPQASATGAREREAATQPSTAHGGDEVKAASVPGETPAASPPKSYRDLGDGRVRVGEHLWLCAGNQTFDGAAAPLQRANEKLPREEERWRLPTPREVERLAEGALREGAFDHRPGDLIWSSQAAPLTALAVRARGSEAPERVELARTAHACLHLVRASDAD